MEIFKLSQTPVSMKLLVTSLLCILGLVYVSLLIQIWVDSEMKPSLVAEAYGSMEYIELADHGHKYLPYYAVYLFALPLIIFMFTSYSEKLKRVFAVLPFILIVIDIGSMWAIPYVWKGFSWVLVLAGSSLAFIFLILFVLSLYDIWLKKT